MKIKTTLLFLFAFSIVSTLSLSTAFAQYAPHTQVGLPEGAIARFGTGNFWRMNYASNGTETRFFIFSSLGMWLYDADTLQVSDLLMESFYDSSTYGLLSPDGNTFAVGFHDGTVKLFDVTTGTFRNILNAHVAPYSIMRFSPDGNILITTGDDYARYLWDVATGNLHNLHTILKAGRSFYFTPDGQTLVTSDWPSNTVSVWDVATGDLRNTFDVSYGTNVYNTNVVGLDGKTLATVSHSGADDIVIVLWDIATGDFRHALKHTPIGRRGVDIVSFSPDGQTLVTQNPRIGVYFWDVSTGALLNTLDGHRFSSGSNKAIFSPDGDIFVTVKFSENSSIVYLWDVSTGALRNRLIGHTSSVSQVSFSPDGKTLATGGGDYPDNVSYSDYVNSDYTVRLWDVSTGTLRNTLDGHTSYIWGIYFSPDGKTLATNGIGDAVKWWDVATGTLRKTLLQRSGWDTHIMGFSSGSGTPTFGDLHPVFLADVTTGELRHTLSWGFIANVISGPRGNTVATTIGDEGSGGVNLWDVTTGTLRAAFIEPEAPLVSGLHGLEPAWYRGTDDVSFSPDGSTLATGSGVFYPPDLPASTGQGNKDKIGTVRLWDATTGQLKFTLKEDITDVNSVSFSSDGQMLASGGQDGWIYVWDIPTLSLRNTFRNHSDGRPVDVYSVSFSPNGQILAAGDSRSVSFWDISTGLLLKTHEFPAETDPLAEIHGVNVYFSPDGSTFASSLGGSIFLWNTNDLIMGTGTSGKVFKGSSRIIDSVHFSPDGSILASRDRGGPVYLWEVGMAGAPSQRKEDINGDGVVNIQDLVLVAAQFGQTGESRADVNEDGVVNIQDLILVAAAFSNASAAPTIRRDANEHLTPEVVQQWLVDAQKLAHTDATAQRGIAVLESLLAALTPKKTAFLPNYPNPFNPETWIPYQLAKRADVSVLIYSADGKLVRTLKLGQQAAGVYESRTRAAYWDGKNETGEPVASGVYFCTLKAGEFSATRKMLIRK
ncbi:MAG: T9SS type A sorting domain-containing protein [Candidatus Poribacteria bacterium]|nr:T9SS type A sorting domain-containing protein [Candidatus Poribacteria bacterium]